MVFFNKNVFSLLVMGSLFAVEGKSQLRRKTQDLTGLNVPDRLILPDYIEENTQDNAQDNTQGLTIGCNAFAATRGLEDTFTFILLEFEKDNLNSLYQPWVNGTDFVKTYNDLVFCPQAGAVREIEDAREFTDFGSDIADISTRAIFIEDGPISRELVNQKVLVRVENFNCNACGLEEFKFFFDSSPPVGALDPLTYAPNLCDCRGPSPEAFVQALGWTHLKNATQIPLIDPRECDDVDRTTFTREGVCPGKKSPEFAFMFPDTDSPSASPTDRPTAEPTREPTRAPTFQPTREPTRAPSRRPTARPSVTASASPTDSPSASPTNSPSASPTESPTASPTESPTASPTDSPVASIAP